MELRRELPGILMADQYVAQSRFRRVISALLLLAVALLLIAIFQLDFEPGYEVLAWSVIIIQSLFVIDIHLSRIRHRRLERKLKVARNNLAQRVAERTERLRSINNQLYNEIARHELTEALLRETQDYLHSIINSMPSVLIGVTRDSQVTHWNLAAQRATDIAEEDALHKHLHTLIPALPVDNTLIRETIDRGIPTIRESLVFGSGEEKRYLDVTIYPLTSSELNGAVVLLDDVSMRVRVENLMIQNEKMMSLGELAAGMAHEINNPLTAILNSVQNINRRSSPELRANHAVAEELGITVDQVHAYMRAREIFQFLDAIREAGERSAHIVKNMLEFSRVNASDRKLTDVAALLEHSLELARNSFDLDTPAGVREIEIKREFYPDLPPIECSQPELQQVFLNLLMNAHQAFNQPGFSPPDHPTLTLRSRADADFVHIEIEDNGPGMPESVSRHIFEPFFTTKEVGQGTGLGLSITYFIVTEHHGGTIEVETEPGRGTNFIISLPIGSNPSKETGHNISV